VGFLGTKFPGAMGALGVGDRVGASSCWNPRKSFECGLRKSLLTLVAGGLMSLRTVDAGGVDLPAFAGTNFLTDNGWRTFIVNCDYRRRTMKNASVSDAVAHHRRNAFHSRLVCCRRYASAIMKQFPP